MILVAYILATILAIVAILLCHTNRRMNSVTIVHGLVFGTITIAALLSGPVPITTFTFGSQFFYIDHLAIFEILIAIVIFTLSAVYAGGYVESLIATGELEKGSLRLFYASWSLLFLVIVLAFCSDNLALFWILAEMTTIISAMLIAVLSAKENIDAAIKYIFVASTAMLFSFAGFIFLFEVSRETLGEGTLNWTVLVQHAPAFPAGLMIACFALVFIGFAAKSGVFPFHTWLPEAHAKAPSAVSALLSGVLLNVGIYAIIRMMALVHQTDAVKTVSPFLMLFGVLTIAIAAFSMLSQKNLKKLIAFSSIENMGVLLVGLAIATPVALFWVIFYIMAHAFTKAELFLSAGILHRQYHSKFSGDAPDEIRDVFRIQPLAAWGVIIGGLSIIGIPLFPIFLPKLFILLQLGSVSLWLLPVVLVLLFIAASALGYFVIVSFTQRSSEEIPNEIELYITPRGMKIPVIILILLIVAMGIFFPSGEISFINQIVTELRF